MLPNFLVIGAGRSGTTSLHHYLGRHPDVFLPGVKSPSYFYCQGQRQSDDPGIRLVTRNFFVPDAASYEALFDGVRNEKAVGEVSPAYLASLAVPQRIAEQLPGARLIAILRNPVERVHARFVARLRDGLEGRSDLALIVREERDQPLIREDAAGTYLAAGFCSHVLAAYCKRFDRDKMKLHLFDDLKEDPAGLIASTFDFLEVDSSFEVDRNTRHNASGGVIRNPVMRTIWTRSALLRARAQPYVPGWIRGAVSSVVKSDLAPRPLEAELRAELTALYREEIDAGPRPYTLAQISTEGRKLGTTIRILELGLIGWAFWPWARLLGADPFRRMFPRAFFGLLAAGAGFVATAILLALFAPLALHLLAASVAIGLIAVARRNRPGSTVSADLPPGVISIARSVEALADRRFYQKRFKRHGPIFKMAQFHNNVICVTGIERGHRLFRERADQIGPCPLPFSDEVSGGFLRYMDDGTYDKYGPLFRKALSGPVTATAASVARTAARQQLACMAAQADTDGGRGVRPGPHIHSIVHDTLAASLLGIVPGSAAGDEVKALAKDFSAQDLNQRLNGKTRAALMELRRVVRSRAEAVKSERAEDEPSSALLELHGVDPSMPDDVCIDNLLFILKISTANVSSLLHWILQMLGENQDWVERIREERGTAGESRRHDITNRISMETLRLAQSEYLYRSVRTDFEFEGFRFPKGWLIRQCVWESHRDPATFQNPETFDPDRHLDEDFPKQAYSPFGCPHHGCNGVALTYSIAKAFMEELAEYSWKAYDYDRVERDFRHWSHWRPVAAFSLALRAVPGRRPALYEADIVSEAEGCPVASAKGPARSDSATDSHPRETH